MNYFKLRNAIKHQRGIALVETLILSGPVLLFLLALPSLGKLIDMQQSSIQASRYLAWQHTINEPTDTKNEIYERFFTKDSSMHAPKSLVGRTKISTNSSGFTSAIETYKSATGIAVAEKMGAAVSKSAKLLDRKNWDLESNGVVQARISLELGKNFIFNSQGAGCSGNADQFGCINEFNGIMVDGWNAGNDAMTKQRSSSFVPTSKLDKVGKILSKLGQIPMLEELKGLKNALGCVPTAVLPGRTVKELPKYKAPGGEAC